MCVYIVTLGYKISLQIELLFLLDSRNKLNYHIYIYDNNMFPIPPGLRKPNTSKPIMFLLLRWWLVPGLALLPYSEFNILREVLSALRVLRHV